MTKKSCIILDTNIIESLRGKINDVQKKLKDEADFIIPEMVLKEIEGHTAVKIRNNYNEIERLIKQSHFNYEKKFDINKFMEEEKKRVVDLYTAFCHNKVLKIRTDFFDEAISRCCFKVAPFIKSENSSDKGFKDTIIWLSILNDEMLKKYDNIVFFTKDKAAFENNKEDLRNEFYEQNKKQITIIQNSGELLNYFKVEEQSIQEEIIHEEENSIDFCYDDFMDVREELDSIIDDLLYEKDFDNFGNVRFYDKFEIHNYLKEEDVLGFMILLEKFITDHIFYKEIEIGEIFIGLGISVTNYYNVNLTTLVNLNNLFKRISFDKALTNSFIARLKDVFNSKYKKKNNIEDDPFADFANVLPDDDLPF